MKNYNLYYTYTIIKYLKMNVRQVYNQIYKGFTHNLGKLGKRNKMQFKNSI